MQFAMNAGRESHGCISTQVGGCAAVLRLACSTNVSTRANEACVVAEGKGQRLGKKGDGEAAQARGREGAEGFQTVRTDGRTISPSPCSRNAGSLINHIATGTVSQPLAALSWGRLTRPNTAVTTANSWVGKPAWFSGSCWLCQTGGSSARQTHA